MKSAHTCRYICGLTPLRSKRYICYRRRSSYQTFHPYTSNLQILWRVKASSLSSMSRHPSWIDAAKIRLFSESCNIVSCFFYFCSDFQQSFPRFLLLTKVIQKNEPLRVRFSPFGILFNPNRIFTDEMGVFFKCHLKESIAIFVEFIEIVNGEITLYALPGPLSGVG